MHETNPTLVEVLKVKTGCAISPEEIKRLQYFYRNHSPDITFHDLQDFSWKDKIYDAVLIDGDHTIEGLTTDLENSFKHISHNGILFIDDFAYDHLRNVTESFCRQYDQKLIYTSDIEGEDLAVIQANKK
jgi:hypothetical protein